MPLSRPPWLRLLPTTVRIRIEQHPNLLKIMANIGWLFTDKIIRMAVGLIIGVWVARYLGPRQFGAFNYALAFVGLFTSIATLGLNGIVVRDIVRNPEDADATLGTAFVLQIFGGIGALLFSLLAAKIAEPDDTTIKIMIAVAGSASVFRANEVIKYWFEAKVQSKLTIWVENGAFLLISASKILLILSQASLMTFVWLIPVEAAFVATGLAIVYKFDGHKISNWNWRYQRARTLLADSWPLILSGLAAMIYMRIDQIMLGKMQGETQVGLFSAAVRITETIYVIPMIIVASIFPAIIEAKSISNSVYYKRLSQLFNIMSALALSIAIPTSILSYWIIGFLYGSHYYDSSSVLAIQVWASIFVFSGIASSRWFIVEGLQKYTFYRTVAGAITNISLNLILIPPYGIQGAAWATLISQAVASVLFNALNTKTRPLFYIQVKSMAGFDLIKK